MEIAGNRSRARLIGAAAAVGALGVGLCLAFGVAPAHAAGTINKTILSANDGKTLSKTVSKYDVTGDGVADSLAIKKYCNYGKKSITKLSISVNGKHVKTIKLNYEPYATSSVKYLRTKNKKPFLFIQLTGANADGVYGVYKYRKGKLVKLLSQTSAIAGKYGTHMYIESAKAKGKKVVVRYGSMTFTMAYARYSYTYSFKSGKLKRTKATAAKLKTYQSGKLKNLNFTLKTKLYKRAGSKKVKCVAPANAKVRIIALKCIGKRPWVKVKLASGKTGWVKGVKSKMADKIATQTSYKYSSLFMQLQMAG